MRCLTMGDFMLLQEQNKKWANFGPVPSRPWPRKSSLSRLPVLKLPAHAQVRLGVPFSSLPMLEFD